MSNYYVSSDGRNNSLNILKNRYKSLTEDKLKYFLDLFPELLRIENTSSNYSKYLGGFLVSCEFFDKENAELKARLAHVESELKVSDEYILDKYLEKDTSLETVERARQRIKERKEFNNDNN